MMNKTEAKKIADLCIEVRPAVEDAFHFLNSVENDKDIKDILKMSDSESEAYYAYKEAAQSAGDRLLKLSQKERMEAIRKAYQMIDNVKKYGVACVAWMPD
jgi:hypothetical protein